MNPLLLRMPARVGVLIFYSLLFVILTNGCAQSTLQPSSADFKDYQIYVEAPDSSADAGLLFAADNHIYVPDREFVYDYYILKDGERFKVEIPDIGPIRSNATFDSAWHFVNANAPANSQIIGRIGFKVLDGVINESQTVLKYVYYRASGGEHPFHSRSGLIENDVNVWAHPPREKYFKILELNPFPYVHFVKGEGEVWFWQLDVGDVWGDYRWLEWRGAVSIEYQYRIRNIEILSTPFGDRECTVVEGVATSRLGETRCLAFFDRELGFVKLAYKNIDDSQLIFDLVEVKNLKK